MSIQSAIRKLSARRNKRTSAEAIANQNEIIQAQQEAVLEANREIQRRAALMEGEKRFLYGR